MNLTDNQLAEPTRIETLTRQVQAPELVANATAELNPASQGPEPTKPTEAADATDDQPRVVNSAQGHDAVHLSGEPAALEQENLP